jgi:hypothetical protein
MSDPQPWHFTTWLDLLDHWQTLVAGVLAVLAAWRTIRATVKSADREVKASQEQTAVAQRQIDTTVRLEQERDQAEASAFFAMLGAAMTRVEDEVIWARKALMTLHADIPTIRASITKGAFDELRAVCVRRRFPLTGEFLDLEREIDNFALPQWDKTPDLGQLGTIESKATKLRDKAASS